MLRGIFLSSLEWCLFILYSSSLMSVILFSSLCLATTFCFSSCFTCGTRRAGRGVGCRWTEAAGRLSTVSALACGALLVAQLVDRAVRGRSEPLAVRHFRLPPDCTPRPTPLPEGNAAMLQG